MLRLARVATTDVAARKAFYGDVPGREAQDASTPDPPTPVSPPGRFRPAGDGGRRGEEDGGEAEMDGDVGVDDIELTTGRIKRLGGSVRPPTDTNIGRTSVVADPQTAILPWSPR